MDGTTASRTTNTSRTRELLREERFMSISLSHAPTPTDLSSSMLASYPGECNPLGDCTKSAHDARTGPAGEGSRESFGTGDERFHAAFLDEPDAGLDFRQHRAGFEMTLGNILFGFRNCQAVERLLVGLAEVETDLLDSCRNHEQVGADFLREHGGREILVNDGGSTTQIPLFILHYGNPASARCNNNIAFVDQVSDDFRLDDSDGFWGRHDAPPAATGILDHCPFLDAHTVIGLFLLVELADGFAGFLEGGVILVHQRLCYDRRDRLFPVAPAELVLQRLLDLITNGSLGVRSDGIQRHFMQDPA